MKDARPPLVRAYGLLLLTLFPLACRGYGGLTAFKTQCFYLSMAVLLPALLLTALLQKTPLYPLRLLRTLPGAAVALLLALSLLSAFASPYGNDVWLGQGRGGGLLALALYAALFYACLAWARPGRTELCAVAGTLLLMEVVALLQLAGGNPLGFYPRGWSYADGGLLYNGRFLSTLGNTGQLGAWFCLAAPALLAAVCVGRGRLRWLLLAPALGAVYIMARAEMEGALLGLGLGLLLLCPWLLGHHKRTRRRLLLLAPALLLLALLLLYFYDGPPQGTLYEASRLLRGEGSVSFGSYRIGFWQAALTLIGQRPWLGWGPDCFAEAYASLFTVEVMRVDAAHNEYLNLAVCLGVPAALAYLAALLSSLTLLLNRANQDRRALVGAAALLCYSLQAAFNFSTPIVAPAFWAVWGMSLAALHRRRL